MIMCIISKQGGLARTMYIWYLSGSCNSSGEFQTFVINIIKGGTLGITGEYRRH